jgi:hypothetical protein
MPGRTARTIQRPAHIDLQCLPPLVGIRSRDWPDWASLRRVVHQEIYRANHRLHPGDHVLHLVAVGDIAPHSDRLPPAACDLFRDTGDIVLRACADRHYRTRLTQSQGNGPADPPARASDQRDLSIQTNQRAVLPRGHSGLPYSGLI